MASNLYPNFIVIFCDNLGFGDIGCFGSNNHRTPNLDRMAREGLRLTSFYSAGPVCTPARAALLTGCYAQRVDLHLSDTGGCVLRPVSAKGLNPSELTIAALLKAQGYATACIGKWHLGDQLEFLPTRHGFDSYFGIPYSEDMVPAHNPDWPPLPLMENEKVIEAPADLGTITRRYTEKAIEFITANRDRPFFLYLPHAMPGSVKNPQAGAEFRGRSANGSYGDVIEEIDWSCGRVVDALARLGIEDRTLVLFASDHGAVKGHGGSNLPFSGWGYSTSEGGMRVPCIARWPSRILAGGTCDALCTTMDLLPTFAQLAGAERTDHRTIDGRDIWDLLSSRRRAGSPHEAFYYYQMDQIQAVRSGQWKLHLQLGGSLTFAGDETGSRPLMLVDLSTDPGETTDVSPQHPGVVDQLQVLADRAREDLGDRGRRGRGQRAAGVVADPEPRRK